jgi:hypothetical protein
MAVRATRNARGNRKELRTVCKDAYGPLVSFVDYLAMSNSAAWLVAVNTPLEVGPIEDWKPGKDEILIEVKDLPRCLHNCTLDR